MDPNYWLRRVNWRELRLPSELSANKPMLTETVGDPPVDPSDFGHLPDPPDQPSIRLPESSPPKRDQLVQREPMEVGGTNNETRRP